MTELLYDVDSAWIAGVLLAALGASLELGHRIGRRRATALAAASRDHLNTVQAAVMGMLALVLGFTFSLSLQRFDNRSEAVVDEANAIGTTYLRASLLPTGPREHAKGLLRDYLDARVDAGVLRRTDGPSLARDAALSAQQQARLWELARGALAARPDDRPTAMFVEALNAMFDSYARREAGLGRHVPELVLLLLFGTYLLAAGMLGYGAGAAGHRPSRTSWLLVGLIVVLVFIVLDLDRPQRGLIQVSQRSMLELQASVRGAPVTGQPASGQGAASVPR